MSLEKQNERKLFQEVIPPFRNEEHNINISPPFLVIGENTRSPTTIIFSYSSITTFQL